MEKRLVSVKKTPPLTVGTGIPSTQNANSSDELPVREMQSAAARAVYQMVPLSMSTAVSPAHYVESSPLWKTRGVHV